MKRNICLFTLFFMTTIYSFAQVRINAQKSQLQAAQEKIKVLYMDEISHTPKQSYAVVVNNIFWGKGNSSILKNTISPDIIEKLYVSKSDTIVDNVTYHGTLYITLKENSEISFSNHLSLKDFAKEYIKDEITNKIYILDDQLLNLSDTDYFIIPSQIGSIEVEKSVLNLENNDTVYFIKINTKKHLKSRPLYIRGNDLSMN